MFPSQTDVLPILPTPYSILPILPRAVDER